MRFAALMAIAIHAAVLFLVHPSARRPLDEEAGNRLDVTLAPGTLASKSPPARIARAPSATAPRPRAAPRTMSPAGTSANARQAEQTPVMTAQTNEPTAPSSPATSPQNPQGTPGEPAPAGPPGTEATQRNTPGGSEQVGADDAAAILSYVNRLTRAMRRAPQGGYTSTLSRQVRVQIALDRGAPSVRVLGSSDVREFDQLSVAAANRALVAVKPPVELFDKRFRFSACVRFNSEEDNYSVRDDDARAGERGPDGMLELYFEHGVHCDTAVADDDNEPEKTPPMEAGLARYRDALVAEVRKLWFYPSAAHRRDQGDLEGTVAVQIASEGGPPLARASYSATNRYPPLNDAAEVIAHNAIAAVALPADLQGKPFRFEVAIEFKPVNY
jgi:outer membrane biosynthesis protein TonB